jgi:acyl-CoA synthetase (AMP-forming)/AMP-acid ligase II
MDEAARARPNVAAVIDGRIGRERLETFAALADHSRRLATLFARHGLRANDGMLLLLPMSAELYHVIAAALRLGIVPAFIDPAAGSEHFDQCLRMYPIRAFVGTWNACLLRLASPPLRKIPLVFVSGRVFPGAEPLHAALRLAPYPDTFPADSRTPAMLAFTSGSTGVPKGMLRTHGFLIATYETLARHFNPTPGEVDLATMPVVTFTNLAAAVTSLIPDVDLSRPGKVNPRRLANQIVRWRASSIVASPALLERLADECLSRAQSLHPLRQVFVGGAPVFPRLLDKLGQVAPHAKIFVLYGSGEAEPIAKISREEIAHKDVEQMLGGQGLLVGRPVPEITLRILHDQWGKPRGPYSAVDFDQEAIRDCRVGEIVVSGPHVSPGYLGGYGDAETKFRVDDRLWHRTGDAGWLDDQGRLWLMGRCSARIEDAAGTLYPFSVEAALSAQPEIVRSAFLAHRGQRWLVLEQRRRVLLDPQAIAKLIPWAKIESLVIAHHIPVDRRHNAKIDYPALLRQLNKQKWITRVAILNS